MDLIMKQINIKIGTYYNLIIIDRLQIQDIIAIIFIRYVICKLDEMELI